jgi:hypothetical protein
MGSPSTVQGRHSPLALLRPVRHAPPLRLLHEAANPNEQPSERMGWDRPLAMNPPLNCNNYGRRYSHSKPEGTPGVDTSRLPTLSTSRMFRAGGRNRHVSHLEAQTNRSPALMIPVMSERLTVFPHLDSRSEANGAADDHAASLSDGRVSLKLPSHGDVSYRRAPWIVALALKFPASQPRRENDSVEVIEAHPNGLWKWRESQFRHGRNTTTVALERKGIYT